MENLLNHRLNLLISTNRLKCVKKMVQFIDIYKGNCETDENQGKYVKLDQNPV